MRAWQVPRPLCGWLRTAHRLAIRMRSVNFVVSCVLRLASTQFISNGGSTTGYQALSQGRADSVKAYFVSKGIEEGRLTAKGYGDTMPAVDPAGLKGGKLTAARTKNRRVEFKLISNLTQ